MKAVSKPAAGPRSCWIDRTVAAERRALPYRRHPLRWIQRDLGPAAGFETAFSYTRFSPYGETALGARVLNGVTRFEHTQFALLANVGHNLDQRLVITLNADGRVLPQWSVEILAEVYDATLTRLVAHEDALITAIPEDIITLMNILTEGLQP